MASVKFEVAKPFATTRQLVGFVCLLAAVLSWPLINVLLIRAAPADVHGTVPPRYVNYRFIGEEMARGGEVDVLAVGASDAWTAFDTLVLEAELGKLLGRKVRVLNFGTNWYGAEGYYAKIVDALRTLKPKVVLVPDVDSGFAFPHELTKFWWRADLPVPADLSRTERNTLYAAAMLGAPHYAWAQLRGGRNIVFQPGWASSANAMRQTQGFLGERHGWLSHLDPNRNNRRKYVDTDLPVPQIPVDELFYQGKEDERFKHLHYTYNRYQSAFMRAMEEAVRKGGGLFATVSIPTHFREKPNEQAIVRLLDGKTVKPWPHIGVSMTRMFPGLGYDQMVDYYSNESHLSAAGARLFCRTIAPAIAKLVRDAERQ